MNDHISILLNFFNEYIKDLSTHKIISEVNKKNINIDYNSKSKQGDVSSNFFLVIQKKILDKNFDLKSDLKDKLIQFEFIEKFEISNSGFINIFFNKKYLIQGLNNILDQKNNYGVFNFGKNKKINIEYVSANPTGPIHIAHIRGAVFGDVLSSILKKTGFNVIKEYYVNDAGSQIEILGNSLYTRYCQLLNIKADLLNNEYPGEYLIEIARELISKDNDKWIKQPIEKRKIFFKEFAVNFLINNIKKDLNLININFDKFTLETDIIKKNLIDKLSKLLKRKDLLYEGKLSKPKGEDLKNWEPHNQLLFKSSSLFDNEDRVFKKPNGDFTYFANDAAYHYDKYLRQFDKLINIWGADHIGYIPRMKSVVYAITNDESYLEVLTCQIVRLIKNSQIIKMSKREGNFITLRDVFRSVGKDALRYFMISTKNETSIDFDIDKVLEKNKDNPVFYCQYAYARASSVINKAKNLHEGYSNTKYDHQELIHYISEYEWEIILKLLSYPYMLIQASKYREPHRITNYLEDLSASFHAFWNKGKDNESLRMIHESNLIKTQSKLIWLESFRIVFKNAFDIIGINAPESM